MKPGKLRMIALPLTLALASFSPIVTATDATPTPQQGSRYGAGPGMMPGWNAGHGPGTMGGYGPGTMGGYGPGMMGGYGPGMMGGYGPGPRWGGRFGDPFSRLDLSSDQKEKIAQINEDMRERNWATMGQLRTEAFRLRRLYSAEKPDPDAVTEQQRKVDDLRRQLTKARVEAHNEMQSVLTKEQRDQLRANAPWWAEDESIGD